MSLLFNPQKSHRHLHRGLRQCSRGKVTKSLGIKTHLGKKTSKKRADFIEDNQKTVNSLMTSRNVVGHEP